MPLILTAGWLRLTCLLQTYTYSFDSHSSALVSNDSSMTFSIFFLPSCGFLMCKFSAVTTDPSTEDSCSISFLSASDNAFHAWSASVIVSSCGSLFFCFVFFPHLLKRWYYSCLSLFLFLSASTGLFFSSPQSAFFPFFCLSKAFCKSCLFSTKTTLSIKEIEPDEGIVLRESNARLVFRPGRRGWWRWWTEDVV